MAPNVAAAAAKLDSPAALVPAVPFKERLAKAGYVGMHPASRLSQEMFALALPKAKSTKQAALFLDSRLSPWRNSAWTKGKTEVEATIARAAETAKLATGGALVSSAVIANAAFVEVGKALQEKEMTGTWIASVTRILHMMAIPGFFGDGGLSVACGYLTSRTLIVAERGPRYARLYDVKLRKLVGATEAPTVDEVMPSPIQ